MSQTVTRALGITSVIAGGGGRVLLPRLAAPEALTDSNAVVLTDQAGEPLFGVDLDAPDTAAGDLALFPGLSPVDTLTDAAGTPLTDARGQPLWALDLAPYTQEPA